MIQNTLFIDIYILRTVVGREVQLSTLLKFK